MHLLRRLHRQLLPLVAALFVLAQLGAATHPLHAESSKADVACAFCIAGSHLVSPPVQCHDWEAILAHDDRHDEVDVALIVSTPSTFHFARGPPGNAPHIS